MTNELAIAFQSGFQKEAQESQENYAQPDHPIATPIAEAVGASTLGIPGAVAGGLSGAMTNKRLFTLLGAGLGGSVGAGLGSAAGNKAVDLVAGESRDPKSVRKQIQNLQTKGYNVSRKE